MADPEAADPHLNLFRRFRLPFGSQEYENNITHALINTLRLSDPRITRSVLTHLVPDLAAIPVDWTDIAWGLQRPACFAGNVSTSSFAGNFGGRLCVVADQRNRVSSPMP